MSTVDDIMLSRAGQFLVVLTLGLTACTSMKSVRAPAHIEIQEAVGFTITEDARISDGVRTDYDTALNYLAQGRYEEGIALLEVVVEAAPQLSAPRVDLGIAYHRAGNLAAAESNLLAALESNPEHPVAYNELGIVYRKTGRIAEARRSYEAALEIYPGYHYARRNLAVLCDMYFADLPCALENYEAYLTTAPGDDEAAMWIADVRNRMAQ